MKKTAIFLAVMLVLSLFVMSSCDLVDKIPGLGGLIGENKPCTEHVDENGDYICDHCEAELEKNDTPNDTPCEHADENKDHKCDKCEAEVGEHKAAEGSHNCGYCGAKLSDCAAAEDSHNCSICGAKLSDCVAAEGSHNCSICGTEVSNCAPADKSHNCFICGTKLSDCAAAEGSHNCSVCDAKLSDCVAAEDSHNCSICGEKASDCVAAEKSHNCAVCDAKLSDCVDADTNYVCDICEAKIVVTTTIVLDPESEHATPVQGPQVVRVGEFDIILSSEKSRIESKNVTFTLSDGSSSSQNYRINFNGSETIYDAESGTWKNTIMFMTAGKGTVTIYWQHGGKGSQGDTSSKAYRNVAIWNDKGEILDQTKGQFDYEDARVTTFEFDAAGTYYIGNLAGANNFFYVEVTYEGEKVSLPDLAKYKVHFSTGDGSAIESLEIEEGALLEKPADPTKEGFEFDGWYKDEALTSPWNFSTDRISGETTLYAKWKAAYVGEFEEVHYELNIGDLETGTRSEDDINGRFIIVSGSEVRTRTKTYDGVEYTKSVKIGNNTTKILINVPGDGKLAFLIQNGSSGAATQFTQVIGPDGTVYNLEFAGADESNPVVKIELDVTEGVWTIARGKNGGTQDVFFLSLDCSVPVSAETGFELVAPGKVDYLAGEELDPSKLNLNAIFESGKTEPLALENVTIDSSAVNMAVSGTYPVVISYKEYSPITYYVNVYAPESIELGFDAVEKIANSSAGNGVYFNHSWKEVYLIGEEINTDGLSVIVIAKCGDNTLKFKVDDYKIEGFDSSEANIIKITVSAYGVQTDIYVHITDENPTPNAEGVYQLLVDPAYLGIAGAISGPYHVFGTIQAALDYAAHIDANAVKELYIAPGYYREKLEITIPNLTIIGWGETPDEVVIEWDSLYGLTDAGGFTHTTDSTQTVAIRDNATGVTIKNLTISNAFNSKEYFDKTLGVDYAEHRALALLVQADRFIMEDCILLGYQDTLELFTGRQYFKNVAIHGYTDFIFGTNNTTLFENCVINTIYTGKTNGGYLTAFKGSNKGAADAITYGAIFYHCKFTADEGVSDGLTAIGRPWGAYAAVAVIECELGSHIATTSSGTADKNERYVIMTVKPTDETVQFVEYNNTGAGAITEAVAGMRFLTAEEAALYIDFATIFGTTNNKVYYLDPWDPKVTDVVEDDRTYYYFDQNSSTTGTSHTFDTTTTIAKGGTLDWAGLHISAENGNVAWNANGNALNMKAGAFISFDVPAGTTVSVTSYPGYNYFTINGVGTSADTLVRYFAEATTVTVASVGDLYLYNIIINPGEEAPEAPTATNISVSGMKVDYNLGEEIALDGASVNLHYSDNSVLPVADYTVDSSAVDVNTPGEYVVVFTYGEMTVNVTVTYMGDPSISESTTIDLSATGAKIEKATGTYKNLTIDATNGKFADNGSGWVQVNTGTVITFAYKGEAEVSVTAYGSADNFDIVTADGVCTITAVGNDYLKAISVKIKKVYSENTTIDLSATGVKIEKATGVYEGLSIDATAGKFADNGSGWVQINQGTIIKLNVADGASVSAKTYQDAEIFTIEIADGVCTLTCTANGYIGAITVTYPIVYDENTTIDLSATGVKIEKATGVYEGLSIDATGGKFADNGSGWVQVNAGTIIKLNVADGASVTAKTYQDAEIFTIEIADGVCTLTCTANGYIGAITVSY